MKNSLLLLGIVGLLMQCDNGIIASDCPTPPTCGDFRAMKDEAEWVAAPTATYAGRDTVTLLIEECSQPCQQAEVEWLSINRIPTRPGTYSLRPVRWGQVPVTALSAWFYTVIGGDATGERYNLYAAAGQNNELIIRSYNPTSRELQGQLTATFVIDPDSDSPGRTRPDTVRIREASFRILVGEAF